MTLVVSEVPVCPLAKLQTIFLVTKRKPLSRLPKQKQHQIRRAYFGTGWASDYSVEYMGVFTSRKAAEEACGAKKGWSLTEVPLNCLLPEETCQFRCHEFPASTALARYQQPRLRYTAIPTTNPEFSPNEVVPIR